MVLTYLNQGLYINFSLLSEKIYSFIKSLLLPKANLWEILSIMIKLIRSLIWTISPKQLNIWKIWGMISKWQSSSSNSQILFYAFFQESLISCKFLCKVISILVWLLTKLFSTTWIYWIKLCCFKNKMQAINNNIQ